MYAFGYRRAVLVGGSCRCRRIARLPALAYRFGGFARQHRWWNERYGLSAALFTWLPFIGDPIAIAMGLMRLNPWWTLLLMFIGKGMRYAITLGLLSLTGWGA